MAPFRPRSAVRSRALGLFAAAALSATVIPAQADVGTAEKLFTEAKALVAAGKFADACPKFEASYDADPALGALLNLADCLERDGRPAAAYGRWGDAMNIASTKKDARASFAEERRKKLLPKIALVTVTADGKPQEDLLVYKGDTKLLPGAYGIALPSDPGDTVVQVVRGDQVLWETRVQLGAGEQRTVTVPLDEIAKANPPPVKKREKVERRSDRGVGEAPQGFWSTQRIAGFVVGGGAIVGAGVGFALGGLAASQASTIDEQCTGGEPRYCTSAGRDAADSAVVLANASTWTLIGSGIVAAVAITVIVTAPSDYATLEDRAFLSPWFSPEGGGVVAGARF